MLPVANTADVGAGFSTPSVVGDALYLMQAAAASRTRVVQARSVTDGRLLWSTRIGKVGNPDQKPSYPGSRSTPTTFDEQRML